MQNEDDEINGSLTAQCCKPRKAGIVTQSCKVAVEMVLDASVKEDGSKKQFGDVVKRRDDLWLADCAETG